jgi:serine/threonine-protein kinase
MDAPEIYGRFTLLSRLGTGGMAELWAAQPRGPSNLPTLFALKRMLPADACKPEFVAMFVDEAKVIASLDHPNIARSYEYGQHGGLYYIAMELVRGLDVRRVQVLLGKKGERIPLALSVWIIEQVCEALTHAHATTDATGKPLHLIHRDVTPHNLMLGFDGSVKVVDFGIAKTALQSTATRVGTLKGKVHYMSPEQARGDRVDLTSDLYAASICLWELLAGREAFERDETYLNALQRAQDPQIPRIREIRDDVPPALAVLLDKGLALAPEERFRNGKEMAAALRDVRDALGGGGQVELARWLGKRFARIRDAQSRVLSRVGPAESWQEVDVEAATIRGSAILPYDRANDGEVSGYDLPREGTEVFYSVDVDVELPQQFDKTMPYAPLGTSSTPSTSSEADSWGPDPTEVDDTPGFDLAELRVAFGTEAGDSDGEAEIPIEHHIPEPVETRRGEAEATRRGEADATPRPAAEEPARSYATDPPSHATDPPPAAVRPARSSGLVIGAAVILGAAIVGAAVYLGPLGRPATGRIEIDAQIDQPFRVTVDRRETGPVIAGLEPGQHDVTVSAEGYELLERTVDVTPGATTLVAAALRPTLRPAEEDAPAVTVTEEEAPVDAAVAPIAEEPTTPTTAPVEAEAPRRRVRRPRASSAPRERAAMMAAMGAMDAGTTPDEAEPTSLDPAEPPTAPPARAPRAPMSAPPPVAAP